jgi:hypothetical protein
MEYTFYIISQYVLGLGVLGEVDKGFFGLGRYASNSDLPDNIYCRTSNTRFNRNSLLVLDI